MSGGEDAPVSAAPATGQSDHASVRENAIYRKVIWRLVPLLFIGYFVAYLDRVNVGFAKLQMAGDLSLSDEVYGFGAGIFFIGYFLFEVPSNLILSKVGARRWMARIMISWGILSSCFLFTGHMHWGPISAAFGCTDAQFTFYLLRFLLGLAEAGFYPGVILYLTFWFPAARRAHVIALFMTAIAMSNVVGSPLSGAILQFMDGLADLRGWQWLFLVEGVPSIIVGILFLAILPDGPVQARWLNGDERTLILQGLKDDESGKALRGSRNTVGEVFLDPRIWAFALAFFFLNAAFYALNFWMPTIIQEIGIDENDFLKIGLIAMIPWGLTAIAMVIWARHSDRTGERRWHAVACSLSTAAGLLILAFVGHDAIASIMGLSLVAIGGLTWLAVSWSMPTAFLSGMAAAGGIALINSLANLGGYFGPDLIGRIREANGGDSQAAFLVLMLGALISAGLTYWVAGKAQADMRRPH